MWENDPVLNQRDAIPNMKELLTGCVVCGKTLLSLSQLHHSSVSQSFSSQERWSLTLSLSMHSTAEVAQRFVRLCYDYAQKWYSNVTQCIVDCLLDVSVHFTMHIRKRWRVCLSPLAFKLFHKLPHLHRPPKWGTKNKFDLFYFIDLNSRFSLECFYSCDMTHCACVGIGRTFQCFWFLFKMSYFVSKPSLPSQR